MRCDTDKLIAEDGYKWQDLFFASLAAAAVLASALHFWPFEDSKIWHMLNIPNLCCGLAIVLAVVLSVTKKSRDTVLLYMPHVSILAYLVINILSVSFADSLARPLNYTLKLALVFIGGTFLFQKALSKPKTLKLFYALIVVAVSLSILACIYSRLAFDLKQFGLHGNVFKYGTYIGILVPIACVYLLSGSKRHIFWGALIATAGVFSAGSLGAVLSILAGLLTGFVLSKGKSIRIYIFVCLLLSAAVLFISNNVFDSAIYRDFALKENDGTNLRQRYIEWQAEINLLEKRGITGTGAGCVNDYRSNFYYRLPKLNTLKAFDQNGFIAVGAETGLLGLTCFIWILFHYGRMALKDYFLLRADENLEAAAMTIANTAGFVSAVVANLFSSVHYNGNLIAFVLLLSLISSVKKINGGTPGED
jgi:hypothetical protein